MTLKRAVAVFVAATLLWQWFVVAAYSAAVDK